MLTKKKKLYAKAREEGKNQKDSAIYAGTPEGSAKVVGSRYERDPDVIHYRDRLRKGDVVFDQKPESTKNLEKIESPETIIESIANPCAAENPKKPILSDVEAARAVLRLQLHSDDERIAQGAAKVILDIDAKLKKPSGKKEEKEDAAKAAMKGRFKPRVVK